MGAAPQSKRIFRQLTAYLLLSTNLEVDAIPAPQGAPNTGSVGPSPTPVTAIATGADGKVLTGTVT